MISLVNSARLEMGWQPLGFINRELYSNYSGYTIDVTSGDNLCTSGTTTSAICCSQGEIAVIHCNRTVTANILDVQAFTQHLDGTLSQVSAPSISRCFTRIIRLLSLLTLMTSTKTLALASRSLLGALVSSVLCSWQLYPSS
jgi:hypothetical protein